MIHPDHPSKILSNPIQASILTDEGIDYETVLFQQIQWDTTDKEKDTVVIASESGEPKLAVYSTMQFPSTNDESLDEDDIFHSNNREWLLGKLAEADEDIQAGRVVPSNKALFDDVIARGRARLKAGSQ